MAGKAGEEPSRAVSSFSKILIRDAITSRELLYHDKEDIMCNRRSYTAIIIMLPEKPKVMSAS